LTNSVVLCYNSAVDKETLERMYLAEGLSSCKIAKAFGLSNRAILNWMRKFGIKSRALKEAHANDPRGAGCKSWKGGTSTSFDGYKLVLDPTWKWRYRREQILVMEEFLGRKLRPEEKIHHVNRDRLDNRIENLLVCSQSEHIKIHAKEVLDGLEEYRRSKSA
jgi:hypothetical protein